MIREFKIALSQEHYSDVVYLSQYDANYNISFTVMDKYAKASSIDGYSAKLMGVRSDGLGFQYTSTASGYTVPFTIDTALTALAGTCKAEVVFYDENDLYFGSANIQIVIEAATHTDDTVDADVEAQQTLLEEIQEVVDNAAASVTASVGTLTDLTTDDQSSAVAAINEVDAHADTNAQAISQLNADITAISNSVTATRTSAGTKVVAFLITSGDVIKVVNDSSGGLNVRLRESSTSTTNLQFVGVTANSTVYFTASADASYISFYFNAAGTATVEKGTLIDVEKTAESAKDVIDDVATQYVFTASASGSQEIALSVSTGDVIRIVNDTSYGCAVRLRATSGGNDLQTGGAYANAVGYMTATTDASYVSVYFSGAGTITLDIGRLATAEANIKKALTSVGNVFDMLVLEQGGITVNGEYKDLTTRLRTINTLQGEFTCTCPDGFIIFSAYYFDDNGYIDSYTSINAQTATVTVPDGTYCKLTFCNSDTTSDITIEEIKSSYVLEDHEERINAIEYPPMVKFDADYELDSDVATIVTDTGYTKSSTAMTEIYTLFDALVDNDYVTKVDLAEEMGISYPSYASDYNTYMYKFICANSGVNTSYQTKRKAILLGGIHGDEQAAPFNLYLFAYKLCNDYLTDPNFFKLRSAFDFYIVPCVNGYGMIHETRTNANGVNINRNFPIEKWSASGSAGEDNYTGASAGSEFETQLVIALVDDVQPDMLIDCHNYTYNMNTQFYTDVYTFKLIKLVYQSLADISYVLKKNYSTYFGTGFDFVKNNGGAPGTTGETVASTSRWGYEQGILFSATLEIADCITYLNGEHANTYQDYYGSDTFTIAEYTLRNQILTYGQWVLDNTQ